MQDGLEMNLMHQNVEQEEEKMNIQFNDDQSESGSESKEEQLSKVYEMDLERQRKYATWNWKPCKVRIDRDAGSICIDNDDYFMEYTNKNQLELNKCTISFKNDTIDNGQKIILYLQLLYQDEHTTITTTFRLPQNKMESKQETPKFALFAATLFCYGSKFEKLKVALQNWDQYRMKKKLSQSEIIHIFKIKYQYDLFHGRHEMNKYVDMIENMDEKVIKPLQAVLKLTEFSKREPEQWRERCKKALQIEYEWKILSAQIRVQLDEIYQIAQYSKASKITYQTIPKCEKIQNILKKISREASEFYTELVQPELEEWRKIAQEFRESAANGPNGGSGYQWKIVVGILLAFAAASVIIGIFLCPIAGGAVAGAATAGAATASATTTAATTTSAISTGAWFAIGCSGFIGAAGLGLCYYGTRQYGDSPTDHTIYKEVERVLQLWEQFKQSYIDICHDTEYIAEKHVNPGPGCMWKLEIGKIAQANIMEIGKMSKECIGKIEKTTK